jgi:hypothetical protein
VSTPEHIICTAFCSHFVFFCFDCTGDPVVRWDSYDTMTDSASCPDDHHHDVSSAGSTQSEWGRAHLLFFLVSVSKTKQNLHLVSFENLVSSMKFHENNFDCRLAQGALETCFSVVFLFV